MILYSCVCNLGLWSSFKKKSSKLKTCWQFKKRPVLYGAFWSFSPCFWQTSPAQCMVTYSEKGTWIQCFSHPTLKQLIDIVRTKQVCHLSRATHHTWSLFNKRDPEHKRCTRCKDVAAACCTCDFQSRKGDWEGSFHLLMTGFYLLQSKQWKEVVVKGRNYMDKINNWAIKTQYYFSLDLIS